MSFFICFRPALLSPCLSIFSADSLDSVDEGNDIDEVRRGSTISFPFCACLNLSFSLSRARARASRACRFSTTMDSQALSSRTNEIRRKRVPFLRASASSSEISLARFATFFPLFQSRASRLSRSRVSRSLAVSRIGYAPPVQHRRGDDFIVFCDSRYLILRLRQDYQSRYTENVRRGRRMIRRRPASKESRSKKFVESTSTRARVICLSSSGTSFRK